MYAKVYWITCDPASVDNLLSHYDSVVTPGIKESEHHVGHHMVEAGSSKWLLVSNYHDKAGAEASASLVREMITPMIEQFGMTLEILTEGGVTRSF